MPAPSAVHGTAAHLCGPLLDGAVRLVTQVVHLQPQGRGRTQVAGWMPWAQQWRPGALCVRRAAPAYTQLTAFPGRPPAGQPAVPFKALSTHGAECVCTPKRAAHSSKHPPASRWACPHSAQSSARSRPAAPCLQAGGGSGGNSVMFPCKARAPAGRRAEPAWAMPPNCCGHSSAPSYSAGHSALLQ